MKIYDSKREDQAHRVQAHLAEALRDMESALHDATTLQNEAFEERLVDATTEVRTLLKESCYPNFGQLGD